MRSGSNWVYLRALFDSVVIRDLTHGDRVAEVRVRVPLGRGREWTTMVIPVVCWNVEFAEHLATLAPGTVVQLTGHVSARSWIAGGVERFSTEIQLDSCAVDLGDVWRLADAAAATTAPDEGMTR